MELPDGREVHLEDPSVWPEIHEEMPWEEKVDAAAPAGAMMNLVDNTEQIDALLAEYNAQFEGTEESGCGCTVSGGKTGTLIAFGFLSLLGLSLRRRR
jgi:MYXO-CTERM domain-containing protein